MDDPQSEQPSSTDEDCSAAFRPRAYQLELFEQAKKQNSILVLGTGSGKTFISILLIKELAEQIRKSRGKKRKWTVFVVNTVPLVYQQGHTIAHHTALNVGMYEGSKGVDYWTDEQWETELENNEVIVLVAQIFLDLLLHSRLSMKSVNLLILDECHHATGAHPMREIMRILESFKRNSPHRCPRVMGLTACVLHKKCKMVDVMEKIKDLEITMSSALITSIDADEVMKHTTRPKEKVICFATGEPSEYMNEIHAQLTGIEHDINDMKNIEPKHKKIIIKKLTNIVHVMSHLGDWCGAQAVKYEMEHFEEAEESEEIPALRTLKKLLCQRLEQIHEYCVSKELHFANPMDHVTEKVRRLFEIFHVCNKMLYGLIFVERRNTAKLLYDLLQQSAKAYDDLSFIKPLYVVGANSRVGTDTVIQNELRKQKVTLDKFKRGECNFLVSTSVLEEGVDIRKCNIVIRFDKPLNYRSYVQSRGRARAVPSTYVLLVEHEKLNDLLDSIYLYREIEMALRHICHNRQLPTDTETKLHFAEDEHIPPYEPYGPDGPKITFNSAISLINVYCGQLPQDKFTELVPDISYETLTEDMAEKGKNVRVGIKLPINSCLKSVVYGDWMSNRDHAKKSAALSMCKKLHQIGELSSNLRPAEKLDDSLLEGLVELPIEEAPKKGAPEPGTRKRRQVYKKEVCQAFSQLNGHLKFYSIHVQCKALNLSEIMIDSNRTGTSVGLICTGNLSHCPFPLYFSKWEEVEVRLRCISDSLNVSSDIINQIQHFHKIVFQHLIDANPSLFEYCPKKTGVLIVPLTADSINFLLLQEIAQLDSLRPIRKPLSPGKIFNFERSTFEDAIIYPLYGSPSEPMFYVTEIFADLSPQSKFPDAQAGFDSFEDYFFLKYDMKVTNECQPLIAAKHLPKELNYWKKLAKSVEKSEKKIGNEPPKFVPELCGIFPLKASLWWQIMLVPSILQRLNSFSLSRQLIEDVKSPCCPLRDEEDETIDFDWTEKFVKKIMKPKENLSVLLEGRKDYPIHPFMIVNAITLRGAHDNFDMERLEVLGDSFLKFITAERLFLKYADEHEGRLSLQRSLLVCNRTLYSLAKQRNIPEKIQGFVLNPNSNGMLPGFIVKPQVAKKLQMLEVPFDMWARLPDFNTLEDLEMEVKKRSAEKKGACYNPWTQQELADKSVADCVEALIGVHLLVGGSAAAIDFLHTLGIGVFNNESLLKKHFIIPSAVLCKESWASEEIKRYYDKSCLDRLEEKIQYDFKDKSYIVQAVTHSSFCQNKVTDCYQRLEFLGDAVLDYLMTGMIYSCHSKYSPGQMSDLRSHYVKNETLALVSAKNRLQQHLLHMAPKLQASIDKYLNIYQKGINDEEELNTEEDEEVDWEDVDVPKVLGDLVEAIIGAVYLDSGQSLTITWRVVEVLMGDIIEKTLTDIPLNCIRELYEKLPGEVKFVKIPLVEGEKARYRVEIPGLGPLEKSGKNFRTAKIAAARLALRKLKESKAGGPSSSSAQSV